MKLPLIGELKLLPAVVGFAIVEFLAIGILIYSYLDVRDNLATVRAELSQARLDLASCQSAATERELYEGAARTEAERQCLSDAAAAYDAGRLRGDLRETQADGRYVPRQRNGGTGR